MGLLINIYSKGKYPADALSNFYPHDFQLDGIAISCMEAFLQSLKFQDPAQQIQICQLPAKEAKASGSRQNWQARGCLFWQGAAFSRYGKEYRILLQRAYDAMAGNPHFHHALLDSGRRPLLHTKGRIFRKNTCLTTGELCRLLRQQRRKARRNPTETQIRSSNV